MDINPSSISNHPLKNRIIKKGSVTSAAKGTGSDSIKISSSTGSELSSLELKAGQTLRGEVIDLRFNEVKIMLEPGKQVITAKLSGEIPIAIGQTAEFLITEDATDKITLKFILPENQLFLDLTIQKALIASGLPMTERNKEIVLELLKNQLPIDKTTLQTLAKALIKNQEASPQTLVMMQKHHIPITTSSIRQFEAYKSGNHSLLNEMKVITMKISELLTQKTSEQTNLVQSKNSTILAMPSNDIPQGTWEHVDQQQPPNITSNQWKETILNDVLQTLKETDLKTVLGKEELTLLSRNLEVKIKENPELTTVQQTEMVKTIQNGTIPFAQVKHLIDQHYPANPMDNLQLPTNALSSVKEQDIVINQIFKTIEETYFNLIEETVRRKWMLHPEELAKKEPLTEYYQNLHGDLAKLSSLMKPENEPLNILKEPVKNMQDNLQFMKTLNEIVSYVQLPLLLSNRETHGDLYVFNKKNALRNKKDILNVLIHLDMTELGPLNLHMKLEQERIQATFYLENEVSGKLISEHLPDLSSALSKKGYQFQARVEKNNHKTDFIEDILEHDSPNSSVQRYSFDIRA